MTSLLHILHMRAHHSLIGGGRSDCNLYDEFPFCRVQVYAWLFDNIRLSVNQVTYRRWQLEAKRPYSNPFCTGAPKISAHTAFEWTATAEQSDANAMWIKKKCVDKECEGERRYDCNKSTFMIWLFQYSIHANGRLHENGWRALVANSGKTVIIELTAMPSTCYHSTSC